MKKIKSLPDDDRILYLSIGILSAISFIIIFGVRVINPVYTDWLMRGGDLTQHYLGWVGFRKSAWRFPIGLADSLAYPHPVSVIYTDSIPIMAVFFKLLSPILPSKFQYFGIWGVMCFVLQGVLTGKLLRRFSEKRICIILCSLMTVITPIMIYRMYYHTALAGQWLIIYALCLLVDSDRLFENRRMYIHVALLGLLTVSVQAYMVLNCGIVIAGICLYDLLNNKRIIKSILILVEYIASAALTVALLGGFGSGMKSNSFGLGDFSFNLNSFFNPQGASCILTDLPLYGYGQAESFNYLGAGFFILIAGCIVFLILGLVKMDRIKIQWRLIVVLCVVFVVSMIVAISPTVTYNDQVLFELDLPEYIKDLWSVFRSTARVAWTCVYIIEICIFVFILKCEKISWLPTAVVAVALTIQVYDLHGYLLNIHDTYSPKYEFQSLLETEDFWERIGQNEDIKHVMYCDIPNIPYIYSITDWAFDHDMTVNNFYFSRDLEIDLISERDVALADPSDENLFIFAGYTTMDYSVYDLNFYDVDGLIIGYVDELEP